MGNPVEEQFNAAVRFVQTLPKVGPYQPSTSMKLKYYSLFKQATVGPCDEGKPGFWNVVERAKWEAWNALGDLSKTDAMGRYVGLLVDKLEDIADGFTNNKVDFEELEFQYKGHRSQDCQDAFVQFLRLSELPIPEWGRRKLDEYSADPPLAENDVITPVESSLGDLQIKDGDSSNSDCWGSADGSIVGVEGDRGEAETKVEPLLAN